MESVAEVNNGVCYGACFYLQIVGVCLIKDSDRLWRTVFLLKLQVFTIVCCFGRLIKLTDRVLLWTEEKTFGVGEISLPRKYLYNTWRGAGKKLTLKAVFVFFKMDTFILSSILNRILSVAVGLVIIGLVDAWVYS